MGQKLVKEIKQALYSEAFAKAYRLSPKAFTRNRVLTFPMVVLFLMNFVKGSLQDEIDQFFQAILKLDVAHRVVTRSAICQARKKLSHKVFIGLLDIVCRFLNRRNDLQTYRGFRVLAVDGSTLVLPDTPLLQDHFGIAKHAKDRGRAMARISILHDVLNRVTYDAIIDEYKQGEQAMAWEHLETADLPEKNVFLLDRGYVSFHLLRHIQDLGQHFCVRIKSNLRVVKQLEESGLSEGVFRFKPSKSSRAQLCRKRLARPLRVRVMKFKFGKQTVYLMTNLLGTRKYPRFDLGLLFLQRWQVEESFKVKKCRLKIEQFSGFSPEAIRQDFHAKVFAESLASALVLDVNDQVEAYSHTTQDDYCVSLTQVLAKMKNTIALLFLRKCWRSLIKALNLQFLKSLVARVPGRKVRRKTRGTPHLKLQIPAMAYPPNR